jgi:hypothetical protein
MGLAQQPPFIVGSTRHDIAFDAAYVNLLNSHDLNAAQGLLTVGGKEKCTVYLAKKSKIGGRVKWDLRDAPSFEVKTGAENSSYR